MKFADSSGTQPSNGTITKAYNMYTKSKLKEPSNRHERRAFEKRQRLARSESARKNYPAGYKGQDYEVRCVYAGKKNYIVGWANTAQGIENLVQSVLLHPAMEKPRVIKLTDAQKDALLAGPEAAK